MPYPTGHRQRIRSRIVESARQLFNRGGFETVTIDSIMAQAGLTRGAFYNYFDSKSDLYAEVMQCFFTDPNWKNRWEGVEIDITLPELAPQIVRAYLSRQHYEDVENSCPMVALPSDVARSDKTVKAAFETAFKAMVSLLGDEVTGSRRSSEEISLAIAALCIGGMVVARSLNDIDFADRLRDAATNAALSLGGWASVKGPHKQKGPRVTPKTQTRRPRK